MVLHMTMSPPSPEDFALALGAQIEYVDPDGECVTFLEDAKRITLCRNLCEGRRRVVMDRLVARL